MLEGPSESSGRMALMVRASHSDNPAGAGNEQGSPTATELAWLAGHFDGDGWIGVIRAKRTNSSLLRYSCQTCITTTSERIHGEVLRIADLLGIHLSVKEVPAEFHEGRQQWHTRKWNIRTCSNIQTQALLTAIRPYLIEKGNQAEFVLDYIEWRTTQPSRPGGAEKNKPVVLEIKRRGEQLRELLREDRWRNDPSTTTRLAPALAG